MHSCRPSSRISSPAAGLNARPQRWLSPGARMTSTPGAPVWVRSGPMGEPNPKTELAGWTSSLGLQCLRCTACTIPPNHLVSPGVLPAPGARRSVSSCHASSYSLPSSGKGFPSLSLVHCFIAQPLQKDWPGFAFCRGAVQ